MKNKMTNKRKIKMGLFSGMGDTTSSNTRGAFLQEGNHLLEVQRVKMVQSRKNNGTYFVLEAKVVDSSSEAHHTGQLASWLVKMGGDWPEYALADIKAFVTSAAQVEDDIVDEKFMQDVLSGDGDLLAGKQIRCNVSVIETKRGGEFNKHSFSPVLDN